MLWRLIKFLFVLTVLGGIGLVAFAYVGPIFLPSEFAAPSVPISEPITLDTN